MSTESTDASSLSPLARWTEAARSYTSLSVAFALLTVILRIFELIQISLKHSVPVSAGEVLIPLLVADLSFYLTASAILALIFIPLLVQSPVIGRRAYYAVLAVLGLIQFALIQYFSVTVIPLGGDLFGYTLEDIRFTVSSSAGISITTFLPYIIIAGVIVAHVKLRGRIVPGKASATVFVAVSLLALAASPFMIPSPKDFPSEAAFNVSVNKTHYFTVEALRYFTEAEISTADISEEYPLVREFPYNDVLGPFLNSGAVPPNIVVIIAEGLGRDFVGEGARYGGFLPFLDSLTTQSLYWENFLSNSGRTFGVMPSLLGSLPFGDKGFNELDFKMPRHLSLIRLLKQNNYRVNFMYGGNKNFDKKDVFLEREQVDLIMDESKFGETYHKAAGDASGFTWGYPDGDVFRKAIDLLADQRPGPRMDIYLTMSTHEPFIPPNRGYYLKQFASKVTAMDLSPEQRERWYTYRDQFASLLYFNDAVRFLMAQYALRPDYANTLFIITGDHRIIPIPSATKIDRYHVPLIIFSPMVKEPVRFSSVSSHLDITPTILAYMKANHGLRIPSTAHWLGDGIDTARGFRNIHSIPFMRVKEEIADYLDSSRFISGEQLFVLREDMDLEEIQDDAAYAAVKSKLDRFKQINKYVIDENKLYPQTEALMDDDITPEDILAFKRIDSLGLDMDQLFKLAREKAFAKETDEARLICRRILAAAPNYNDVRTLLGRTYAWNKEYETAKRLFRNVLQRDETYVDAYIALADVQLWNDSAEVSLAVARQGLAMYPQDQELLVRTVKAYLSLGQMKDAAASLKTLQGINPAHPDLVTLTNRVSAR
ncbi:MAG: sulfatase-like hydrolase/transferase [Bacteroidetes bacterium]|nr:sulfatase-like hydrolase/transferase [Bacteroidota bacterium]